MFTRSSSLHSFDTRASLALLSPRQGRLNGSNYSSKYDNSSLYYKETNDATAGTGGTSTLPHDRDSSSSPFEGGALRAGGAANLFSRDYIGLLANYAAVGILYGAFAKTVYPFLNNYLRMEGYQTVAAQQLVAIPWSFKTFIGIASDSFPIRGYRRRPYIIAGWTLSFVMLLIMAILPVNDPYYLFPNDASVAAEFGIESLDPARINTQAPADGAKYILLMAAAAFFYVVADVCCDGIVVELAMREPIAVRGTTQTYIYLTRTLFAMLSSALIGFCFNSVSYGGSFSWSLEFNQVMLILGLAILPAVPASAFFLKETPVFDVLSLSARFKEMWSIVQRRVIWQVMAYSFFSGLFSSFGSAPAAIIQREWAQVQPLNESIFGIVGNLAFAAVLYATKTWGLDWDWRRTIALTMLSIVVVDSICVFSTIWNLFRSQWFWLGVPILEELPYGINFIISTYIVVEVADEGYEAATYGLLTTVSNLSTPVASSMYKQVNSYFDAYQDDITRDDTDARMAATYCYVIMYIMRLLSLGFLILLPRQKAEAQLLKATGGSSKLGGGLAIGIGALALIYSISTNLMSIFPATACLRIAGGNGDC